MTTTVGYSPEVVRRCQQMERAGSWPEDDPRVGTGVVGSLASGAMTRLQVRVDGPGGRVEDARFKVFGCSAAIASASLAADRVVGGRGGGANARRRHAGRRAGPARGQAGDGGAGGRGGTSRDRGLGRKSRQGTGG